MPKSHLHQKLEKLGFTPFVTVTIGNRVYSDDEIASVTISYGKTSNSISATVPTCTIELAKEMPILYNQTVTVDLKGIWGPRRFTGRVAQQEINDVTDSWKTSTITCTAKTIRLFRDKEKFTTTSLTYLDQAIRHIYTRDAELTNQVYFSPEIYSNEVLTEQKEYTPADILGILEKLGIAALHNRDGRIRFIHPAERIRLMKTALENTYPIQRSNAISPAKHSQPFAYVDERPVTVATTREEQVIRLDWFGRYSAGATTPKAVNLIDIDEVRFNATSGNWKYPAIMNIFSTYARAWQTPSIKIDMLELLTERYSERGYSFYLSRQLLQLNEGDFIIFGGDWPQELQGAKTVQGYEEKITPDGWEFEYSLGYPPAVMGYVAGETGEPMPEPLVITWNQAKSKTWATTTKTWEEARNGI